jgi:CheY-like chemotaxis protein
MVRKLAVGVLEKKGYTVLSAADGAECLQAIADHDGTIDLLLTDVVMPDMNGRALFEQVSARYPDIRIVYMSGYTENVIVHHGVLEEDVAFIQKPFTIQTLTRKVREVLDR